MFYLQVRYHWSFLVGDVPTSVKKMPRPKKAFVKELVEEENKEADALEAVEEEAVKEEETMKDAELGIEMGATSDQEEDKVDGMVEVSMEPGTEVCIHALVKVEFLSLCAGSTCKLFIMTM